ncbi:lactonase family protein [Leptospira brenneri]|uniref:3-carboxymuconate cyclase n=1 Tax=Leptospira brenneri TaxID=2023182 RepID=A0A2M9Y014_9LEPT|nr:beta-propeller fold lactonase family protein [Leptospira brenneri]PJZ44914.1 3-carboxymuconate cyclase [Leptospira brenneri]TGK95287.1 3-carboxymuconate cyclase [Leptospira brenneri]
MSALLEFGSNDGKFLCSAFSGLNPFRLHYSSDFFVVRQNEPTTPLVPFASGPIERCQISPSLPAGLTLNESNCFISGTPLVGMNSTKYLITASYGNQQATIPLVIKSLFAPKYAYVVNTTSALVNLYSVNANTGVLSSIGNVAVGGGPESMAVSPSQLYLTVANRSSNDISQFAINQNNGNLTILQTIESGGVSPLAITYHPYKDIFYIRHPQNITTFLVDKVTGNLTLISTIPASTGASSIAIDPFGNYLYVPNYSGKMIDSYRVDPSTGIPDPNVVQSISTGLQPRSLEVLSNGKYLYLVNESDNNISAYKLDSSTGFLNSIGPATSPMGLISRSVATDPTGRFLYMTNQGSDFVSIYGIDPVTGSLVPGVTSSIGTGDGPTGIATDSSGKFLYVTNFYSNTVDMFRINQTDGSLISNGSVGTNTLPIAIVTTGTNP